MSAIITLGIDRNKIQFNEKGWANVDIFVNDETNQYGQNVSSAMAQTLEERESKQPRVWIGNGKVVHTKDGRVVVAEKQETQLTGSAQSMAGREVDTDLPF